MLKKIVLGALLVGFTAILVVGAVIRTSAKSIDGAGNAGRRGQATEYATDSATRGSGGGGRWAQGASASEVLAFQSSLPQADVQPNEWRTVQGSVVSVSDALVEIQATTGEVIPLEGRPLSFATQSGFSLQTGEPVTVDGFDEDGAFKIGSVTSETTGMNITLRDASGRPAWSGQGRQG